MATSLKSSLVQTRAVVTARHVSRSSVIVRASAEVPASRRAFLGLLGTAVTAGAAAAIPGQVQAYVLPWQESTGGLVAGGGNITKSSTKASSEGYTLEGTKKYGVSGKRKKQLLAKARKEAESEKAT